MKFCLFLVLVMNGAGNVFAQSEQVTIHEDKRIALLCAVQNGLSNSGRKAPQTNKGYRVLVCTTTHREEVYKMKAKLSAAYGSMDTYISYETPIFKLKIGDFSQQEAAEKFSNILKSRFHLNATVIPDRIYLPVTRFKM